MTQDNRDEAEALVENERRAHERVLNLGSRTPATNAEIVAAYADWDRAREALNHR